MKYSYLIIAFILLTIYASAQSNNSADNVVSQSPLKHLTTNQYNSFQQGSDVWGMGKVAELNHFPAPQKVFELKSKLSLNMQQEADLQEIVKKLNFKVKEMGAFMIKNERMLDSLFRIGKVNDGLIIYYTNRYGLYEGELRNAILQAHLKTKKILKPAQLRKYDRLLDL
ncbi:MAG: hypothetical protein ACOH2A_10835 [Sphingobacteriaceae bacterium]